MDRLQDLFERWFKTLEDVGNTFILAGIVLVGLSNLLKLHVLLNLGLAAFGAGVIAWGANAVENREISIFGHDIPVVERMRAGFALVWGALFMLGGLLVLGYGILSFFNPRSPIPPVIQEFFATPPGVAILLVGGCALGVLYALDMVFVSDEQGSSNVRRTLKSLPRRLFGVVLFLFFIGLAVAGLVRLFAPGTFDAALQSFLQMLNTFLEENLR